MSKAASPSVCLLCGTRGDIQSAGFRQIYPQKDLPPVLLTWWECLDCKGWFVHPVPASEVIGRYWASVAWLDPRRETEIAEGKTAINRRILRGLLRWTPHGRLLDFGCNFGQFLETARRAGWDPYGFEPNAMAADTARSKGFIVRSGWTIDEAEFTNDYFEAVVANDVFCLVWEPLNTIKNFHRILRPGGVLVMRLTNKRTIMGFLRAFSRPGARRNKMISKILQGQFHSIGLNSFSRILSDVGFNRIHVEARAMTAPWSHVTWRTKVAYLGADLVYLLSMKTVNLSPGVLLFAQKRVVPVQSSNSFEATSTQAVKNRAAQP